MSALEAQFPDQTFEEIRHPGVESVEDLEIVDGVVQVRGVPGSGVSLKDIAGRTIGAWLCDRLGQIFIVENRPGESGNIATRAVVKAAPDGYTLLMMTGGAAINVSSMEMRRALRNAFTGSSPAWARLRTTSREKASPQHAGSA